MSADQPDIGARAREDIASESRDLVDQLNRDLLALDTGFRRGTEDPRTLQSIFRAAHTLKGLAGLVGAVKLARLTHALEDLLDGVRMDRPALSRQVIDQLVVAADAVGALVDDPDAADERDIDRQVRALRHPSLVASRPSGGTGDIGYDLDPDTLGALTEYEEHRLRSHDARGTPLHRVRVRCPLVTIEGSLEALRDRVQPLGEVLTYLPVGTAGSDEDTLTIDVLVASATTEAALRASLADVSWEIFAVKRRPGGHPGEHRGEHRGEHPGGRTFERPETWQGTVAPDGSTELPTVRVVDPAMTVRVKGDAEMTLTPNREDRPNHSVRVDIRRVDQLLDLVGELSLVRSALYRLSERSRSAPVDPRVLRGELHRLHRDLDRHLEGLQQGLLEVRMVPLARVFERLAREVRQLSRALSKDIRLVVTGVETAVDKVIVEALAPPLLHLIQNAIDHGIERPAERVRRGKPAEGSLAINAYQAGRHVVIEVEDDGVGIDPAAVRAAAIRRGLLSEEASRSLGPRETMALLFLQGLSTRDQVTATSGRGVGMDVVRTHIARLGGVVDVASELGTYTRVTVTVPITLAILAVLVVEVAGRRYALPLAPVAEATRIAPERVHRIDGREMTTLHGRTVPLCRLGVLFGHEHGGGGAPRSASYMVVISLGDRQVGLMVDQLVGQQDVVIKPLGASLRHVRGFAGATDLGDQRLALVLDPVALLDEVLGKGTLELRHDGG